MRTSPRSSRRSSSTSALWLHSAESASLRRLRRAAGFAGICLLPGAASVGPAALLAHAAAAILLVHLLWRMDPRGVTLRLDSAGGWYLLTPGGICGPCTCHCRGRFRRVVWLDCCLQEGGRRRRHAYIVFADALGDDAWRRLRRALRIAVQTPA